MPLTAAILDDWNTGRDSDGRDIVGARIVFDGPWVTNCRTTGIDQCHKCSLFLAVGGEDNSSERPAWRHTLCQANATQLALFPSRQFFLNCKTVEQYVEAYIRWFTEMCPTQELLEAELDWVRGFRLLWHCEYADSVELGIHELGIKKHLVEEVTWRLVRRGEHRQVAIVHSYARQLGLL